MLWSALIAFGHLIAFFGLGSALTLQIALLKPPPDIETEKRIQRADLLRSRPDKITQVSALLAYRHWWLITFNRENYDQQ